MIFPGSKIATKMGLGPFKIKYTVDCGLKSNGQGILTKTILSSENLVMSFVDV